MRRPTVNALTALIALTSASCTDDRVGQLQPAILVCADEAGARCEQPLDLRAYYRGETHELAVWAHNRGDGPLRIRSLAITEGDGLAAGAAPEPVAPEGVAALPLTLLPALGPQTATLEVESDDPDDPLLAVALHYEGVEANPVLCPTGGVTAVPDRCAGGLAIDLGAVRRTRTRDARVLLRNTGSAELTLAPGTVSDQSSLPGELSLRTSVNAGTLAPGAEVPVVVHYAPLDAGSDRLELALAVDGTAGTAARLTVTGHAPADSPPTAVAVDHDSGESSVNDLRVDRGVWLDGRDSHDLDGDPLRFDWAVTAAPEGSTAIPDHPEARLTRFAPDRLGAFELTLTVTDSLEQSDRAAVTLLVEPEHALTVESSWASPDGGEAGDVDLHLVPLAGELFGPGDCFFGQPSVDWGVTGDTRDDPTLRSDDDRGQGSERIAVARPAEGFYDVFLHYFDPRDAGSAAITVTVAADDGTRPLATLEGTLVEECEVWHAGTLHWPSGHLVPDSAPHSRHCWPEGAP